jgi:hypothetical protein
MLKVSPSATVMEDGRAAEPAALPSTVKLTVPGPVTMAVDCRCTQLASAAGWVGCQVQLAVVCTWKLDEPPVLGNV